MEITLSRSDLVLIKSCLANNIKLDKNFVEKYSDGDSAEYCSRLRQRIDSYELVLEKINNQYDNERIKLNIK